MSVRTRGLLYLLIGGGVFALFAFWIANPEHYPFAYDPTGIGGALLIGAPGAGAIIGLIELVSGKPFHKVEESWAELSGLQRFLGGTLIVLVGSAVIFTVIAMVIV